MVTTIKSIIERAEKAIIQYENSENWDHFDGRKEGASKEQLKQFQERISFTLPESFIEFYKITNGYEELAMGMSVFSLKVILSNDINDLYGALDDNIEVLNDEDWGKNITKDDIGNIGKDNCLIFGERGKDIIFINFNKPLLNGEYQIVSLSYEYAEAWDSFPEFLTAMAKETEIMIKWKSDQMVALEKKWEPAGRIEKDEQIKKLFSKRLKAKHKKSKPIKSYKWNFKSTDIELPELLIGNEEGEGKGELVRVLYGLIFYMPGIPTLQEIKLAYSIYRKHFPWSQMVHIQNADPYTSLKKETNAEDWEFIDSLFEGSKNNYNWGLRTVDYSNGKSIDKIDDCEHWFNFRAVPYVEEGERPAFLAIHIKTNNNPSTILAMAKEIIENIQFISGHAGYDTFQSRVNHKPTIEIEYQWAKRFAGIRIEDEEYLYYMWDRIWPANWLTIPGNHIISACEEHKYDWRGLLENQQGIEIHSGKFGSIIQAGKIPLLGDVYKGEWPEYYSIVQCVINPLTIHPARKNDITFAGKFDEENMSAAWFDRLIYPEKFYRMGEKEAIWYPVELAKNGASKDEIEKAIEELNNYDGKGTLNNMEIFSAACALINDFKYPDLSDKMLKQAIKWPDTFISCYNNLLVHLLGKQNLKEARKYLPESIKAADAGLKAGEKRAGGVYWNVACVEALEGNLDKAIEYIRKAKETGFEEFPKLYVDEDFKALRGKKEFEELFH